MSDPPFDLGFAEPGVVFESATQNARVLSEAWAGAQLYCPACGAARLTAHRANARVADLYCETCGEDYELKATKGRFGRKVVDGAFAAMTARMAESNNPSLALMAYDLGRFGVTDLTIVPKHFFTPAVIERRKPLAETARRAGWVGCNILLSAIPDAGKIALIRAGETLPRADVLASWRRTAFLAQARPAARGWLVEVMKAVEDLHTPTFTLDYIYAAEPRLAALYPGNHNVRPKIRQQLQVLRDQGWLEFVGRGRYRLRP